MYEYTAVITSVHDGDTFRASVDLGFSTWIHNMDFRLDGLNARELSEEGGPEAQAKLLALVPLGAVVIIRTRKDREDKYGRYLADAQTGDGKLVGQTMIASGYAVPWDGHGPAPLPAWPIPSEAA